VVVVVVQEGCLDYWVQQQVMKKLLLLFH